jgi:hypothetical protein
MSLNLITNTNRNAVRTSLANAQIAVGGDVNPIIELLNDIYDADQSVTQATNITTAVTLNALCGSVTTVSSTLAGAGTTAFTVNNSLVKTTSKVFVSLVYNGTGIPVVTVQSVANGSFVVEINNAAAATVLNSTLTINFLVF